MTNEILKIKLKFTSTLKTFGIKKNLFIIYVIYEYMWFEIDQNMGKVNHDGYQI